MIDGEVKVLLCSRKRGKRFYAGWFFLYFLKVSGWGMVSFFQTNNNNFTKDKEALFNVVIM